MGELMKTMATYYAGLGLRVVPLHGVYAQLCTCGNAACRSPAKHPRTTNGLKDGTADKAVVERMWTRWPFASIGICTGTESGVLVIDFDDLTQVPELLRQWAWAEQPPTWRATTGRGGKHVFFRYDVDRAGIRSRTGVWPKVDVRADGGYVVAAPSPHISGNKYAWDLGCAPADVDLASLPDEIEAILRAGGAGALVDQADGDVVALRGPGATTEGPGRVTPLPRPGELRLPDDEVARIRAALAYIDATERQVWLHVGMALKSTCAGQQAFDLWTEWSMTKLHKFDAVDQDKTWRGLKAMLPHAAEIAMGKVFWLAKQAGAPDFSSIDVRYSDAPFVTETDGVIEVVEAEPENLPGEGAEPVPTTSVEPLPDGFWLRLEKQAPLISKIVKWITSTANKPQQLLAFGNTLVALGALLGRRVRSPGNCRSNLYVFGIAPTAAGKEHSRQCISSLFITAGLGHWIGPDDWKSDSGLRQALINAPSHVAHADEFGAQIAQITSPNAPSHLAGIKRKMLELFGRAGGIDHGPAYADTKMRPREIIVAPSFSVFATTVPERLFDAMTSGCVADGFLNRWICLFGEERVHRTNFENRTYDPPAELQGALRLLEAVWRTDPASKPGDPSHPPQHNIPSSCSTLHEIPRTPDALKRYQAIVYSIDQEVMNKRDAGNPLADLWNRVPEMVEKIAMILAAVRPVLIGETSAEPPLPAWNGDLPRTSITAADYQSPKVEQGKPTVPAIPGTPVTNREAEIGVDDLELAYELLSWSFRRFEAEVGVRSADSPFEANVKRVLQVILKAGTRGIGHSALTRKTQWLRPNERKDVLDQLTQSQQVEAVLTPTATKASITYRCMGFRR